MIWRGKTKLGDGESYDFCVINKNDTEVSGEIRILGFKDGNIDDTVVLKEMGIVTVNAGELLDFTVTDWDAELNGEYEIYAAAENENGLDMISLGWLRVG